MSQSVLISTALCLPVPDLEALYEGRTIVAMLRQFPRWGQQFVLYPVDASHNLLPPKWYYRPNFLPTAQMALNELGSEIVQIKAWARCEKPISVQDSESLEALSQLTVWTTKALEKVRQKQPLFLAHLRVYRLVEPIEMPVNSESQQKAGKFIGLSVKVDESDPVLSDRIFNQRRHQLENLLPPLHPELELLQSAIASLATTNPAARSLDRDLKRFLGWGSNTIQRQPNPNLAWIDTIADLGNRSKELDTGKSNYQAGTDFENVVRDSLEFLGFTVDYAHKGGAGGLDLFCSKPYPLVGECKAGKKIPNDTAVQLLNLGTLRLQNAQRLKQTTKLIIGPGEPTPQLEDAAKVHGMAIINPDTLEKLVKLQSQYPNCVDLLKLKEYLKPGISNDDVNKYISLVYNEIKLRSHIVRLVKNYLENTGFESAGVDALHGAYFGSNPPEPLTPQELREILIELSSPLTGYLGRQDKSGDRFYFLRDLP